MAEGGLDDLEMEEFDREYPRYEGETFVEVDNAQDLYRLLNDYSVEHDRLVDIYNTELSSHGKHLRKNKLAYIEVEKKIDYAMWLAFERRGKDTSWIDEDLNYSQSLERKAIKKVSKNSLT